ARAGQCPAVRFAKVVRAKPFAGRVLEGEVPAATAPALSPKWKRPAKLVGDGGVLMGGDVALGIENASAQDFAPFLTHRFRLVLRGHCRPERGIGEPFIPERRLWACAW